MYEYVWLRAAALVILIGWPVPAMALGVTAIPSTSMTDRPVSIRIEAHAGDIVTVQLTTQRYGMNFESAAKFRVPTSGELSLADTAPLSGSYAGKDAMGLFWSVAPAIGAPKPYAFRRDSDLESRPYTILVTDRTQTAKTRGTRLTLSADVRRRVVDTGSFVATMFASKSQPCHPGVIVLGGSEGGVPEELAAVIASHGFTTLALAYFGAPGLPENLTDIPIETVHRAVAFMHARPEVCGDRRIALLGGSKGAELALVAAARFDDFGVVVAMKPASIVFGGIGTDARDAKPSSWSYQARPLPFANGEVPHKVSAAISAQRASGHKMSFRDEYLAMLQNNTQTLAPIAVERIRAPILVVAGGADELWPSDYMARQIADRLKQKAHPYPDESLIYRDAGHLIGLPYQFAIAELAHAGIAMGGSGLADERASEASWPRILSFLRRAN